MSFESSPILRAMLSRWTNPSVRMINTSFGNLFHIYIQLDPKAGLIAVDIHQCTSELSREGMLLISGLLYLAYKEVEHLSNYPEEELKYIVSTLAKGPPESDRKYLAWHIPEGACSNMAVEYAQFYKGGTGKVFEASGANPGVLLDLAAMFVHYSNQWE